VAEFIALGMVKAAGMDERKWLSRSQTLQLTLSKHCPIVFDQRFRYSLVLLNCPVLDFLQKSPLLVNLVKAHIFMSDDRRVIVGSVWGRNSFT
jgi:hypothetical protein